MVTIEEKVLEFLKHKIKNTKWQGKVFLAGGAVRDQVMGGKADDLDFVVVNGNIDDGIMFAEWLAVELGIYKSGSNPVIYPRFGTAKLHLKGNNSGLGGIELEFVASRKETYKEGSRKPEVSAGTMEDDILRRDLTINSLLQNISTGEIIDLTGHGVNDIHDGIIRTTSDADYIFNEDPLRMLRAIRFSVRFGFKISDETINGIKKNANKINNISSERISDELNKILLTKDPANGLKLLNDTGLLKYVIPEAQEMVGMTQNKHHNKDVFGHTLDVVANTPPNLKTRLMALFHDIGKTLTKTIEPDGSVHFYEHEKVGVDVVRKIMFRLKYPNEIIDSVISGVENHMRLKQAGDDASNLNDKTLRKFAVRVGDNLEDILDLIHADNISHADPNALANQITNIRERLKKLNMNIDNNRPKLPINGNDLIKMGIKPGPIFKDILGAVEDAWYENPDITKEEALEIIQTQRNQYKINEMKSIMKKLLTS